jgi:hypothetical protein
MKRRRFLQTMAAAPAVALPAVPALGQQPPAPAVPAGQIQRPSDEPPKLELTVADAGAEMMPRFFNAQQFAALRSLSAILVPEMNGMPGAIQTGAPEFLDFLIGTSPADRQELYTSGLDALNSKAAKSFNKPFAEVDASQAVSLLAPLREPWTFEQPSDLLARFLRAAKEDVRTATFNSREWNTARSSGPAARRGGGLGQYWYTIE